MLADFERLSGAIGEERAVEVAAAVRFLVKYQFAYAGDRGSTRPWNALKEARSLEFATNVLEVLGLRLVSNEVEQWIGVLPIDGVGQIDDLGIDDTIILLSVAAFWQEHAERGEVGSRREAVSTFSELHSFYEDAATRTGRLHLAPRTFFKKLEFLERRSLIDLGEFDPEQEDHEISIRAMVRLLAGEEVLLKIERFSEAAETRAAKAQRPAGEGSDSA